MHQERRAVYMANILPVSDLRNYNEVLKNCRTGEPVFLTKNGRGRFVVLDIEDYERDRAEKKLLMKLQEAEEAEYAAKTIKEIYGKFENIQMFPGIGADLSKRVSFRTDYKYAVWGNYVIIYKVGEEYVEIYRVVNRYRDITRIFD